MNGFLKNIGDPQRLRPSRDEKNKRAIWPFGRVRQAPAGPYEDRVRTAKDDPTFLLAPVHPVRTYDAIDLNTKKFENLLHRFFAEARLDIEIMDRFGKPFKPREWFLLSLPVIEQAIPMMLNGSIIRHRYDAKSGAIVPHNVL